MSDPLDYRSWGCTNNCKGCRYWSEMLARSEGNGIQAMCINDKSSSYAKYTFGSTRCDKWEEGSLGAIDDPGGNPYQEESHAQG